MPQDKRSERKHRKELKRLKKRRGLAKLARRSGTGAKGKIFCSSTGGSSPKTWMASERRGAARKLARKKAKAETA